MSDHTDRIEAWARRLRAGDEDALAKLFDHYRPQLGRMVSFRMSPALKTRLDESDILQETYLEAHCQLPKYLAKPAVPVYVWLRQVAQERLSKANQRHLRTQKYAVDREVRFPQDSALQLAAPFLAKISSPSHQAMRRELCERVERSFNRLKPEDREVIMLRYFEQIPNTEAAEVLGVTPQGATMRFGRAMARFHELLKTEFEGESHP